MEKLIKLLSITLIMVISVAAIAACDGTGGGKTELEGKYNMTDFTPSEGISFDPEINKSLYSITFAKDGTATIVYPQTTTVTNNTIFATEATTRSLTYSVSGENITFKDGKVIIGYLEASLKNNVVTIKYIANEAAIYTATFSKNGQNVEGGDVNKDKDKSEDVTIEGKYNMTVFTPSEGVSFVPAINKNNYSITLEKEGGVSVVHPHPTGAVGNIWSYSTETFVGTYIVTGNKITFKSGSSLIGYFDAEISGNVVTLKYMVSGSAIYTATFSKG